MKTNIESSISNNNKPLNLKQIPNSRALKQCQFVDFLYSSITGFNRVTLFTALVLGLISKPYFAYAQESPVASALQAVAELYAQEIGDVLAEDHWTRIEFSTTYIDPVVVVEEMNADVNYTYTIGIRNVDEMGFEIILKNCNNSTGITGLENVNYAVIEKSQLPSTEGHDAEVRQQYSWGECATAAVVRTARRLS